MKTMLLTSLVLAATTLAAPADNSTPLAQAKAALAKNDLAAAEALLVPLTTAEKPDAAACHQLGLVRQRQGRAADAAALHEKATKLDGTRPEYFSDYGIALSTTMQGANIMSQAMLAPKMKKAFEKSVELDPDHVAGLIGLARYYTNAPEIAGGSLEKAREFAARVQKLNPFLGALELGNVAERGDDFSAALEHYDTASKLQPKNAGAHASAGRVLAKLGRMEEARARLEIALQLDPKREEARKALATLPAPAR